MNKFINWLETWENIPGRCGKLTKETFFSLRFSCKSLVSIIKYLLIEPQFNLKFILTYKFQTDCLERVFSRYRQSNGGQFNITLNQVFSAEKKMRVVSVLRRGSLESLKLEPLRKIIVGGLR